ncbi:MULTISPECIES: hypothetical protein, partial [unclassified Mesorhizobium]
HTQFHLGVQSHSTPFVSFVAEYFPVKIGHGLEGIAPSGLLQRSSHRVAAHQAATEVPIPSAPVSGGKCFEILHEAKCGRLS